MKTPAIGSDVLARLVVLGGTLVIVGATQTWAVFGIQPLFGWEWANGLGRGFGWPAALSGLAIVLSSSKNDWRVSPWVFLGLPLVALVVTLVGVALAMNDHSFGRSFEQVGLGAVAVVLGALLAAFAGWLRASREPRQRIQTGGERQPLWRNAALIAGGFLFWVEGTIVCLLIIWHGVTGESISGMDFLTMELEASDGYFGIGRLHVGWEVAYILFVSLGVAAVVASLALLGGRKRPLLVIASLWLVTAVLLSVASLRLTSFMATQLFVFALAVVGTWPLTRSFLGWVAGHPREEQA